MRKCLIIRYIPKYLKVIECNISGSVLGTIRSKVDTTVSALIFFYPPPGLSWSVKSKSKCNTTKMPG